MGLFNNIFSKKESSIKSNADFWEWFTKHQKIFFTVVKESKNIEKEFFNKLAPKLGQLRDGFYFVAGMFNDTTAELIITADGNLKNIVFVEELVNEAPQIDGWRFTALKPALAIDDVNIRMGGCEFNKKNLSFFSTSLPDHPDEIDVTIVHSDLTDANRNAITQGVFIFLDNYLGELNAVTTIDTVTVKGKHEVKQELIPIEKLKSFLTWRQKEFIEKYEGVRRYTENDGYATIEAELKSGNVLIATVNTDLLEWDSKASHPWIVTVEIKYDGSGRNGMPDNTTYDLLNNIEEKIMDGLKDFDGYLNVGRQTADSVREIYIACKDFRKPSAIVSGIQDLYAKKIKIGYDIYIDKYWRSFHKFSNIDTDI